MVGSTPSQQNVRWWAVGLVVVGWVGKDRMRTHLKRLTAASFVFFFAKGLFWLGLLGWSAWLAR